MINQCWKIITSSYKSKGMVINWCKPHEEVNAVFFLSWGYEASILS